MGGKRKGRRATRSATHSRNLALFMIVVATATTAQAEGDRPEPTKVVSVEAVDPVCPKGEQGEASIEKTSDDGLIISGDCTDVDFEWFDAAAIRVNGRAKLKENSPNKIQLLEGGVRVYRFESGGKAVEILTRGEASAIVLTKGTATVVMLDKDTIAIRADVGEAVVKQDDHDEDIVIPEGQQRKLSLLTPSFESSGCVISLRDGQAPRSNGKNLVVITSGVFFVWFTRRKMRKA